MNKKGEIIQINNYTNKNWKTLRKALVPFLILRVLMNMKNKKTVFTIIILKIIEKRKL